MELLLAFLGILLAILLLLFSEQGAEVHENVKYHMERLLENVFGWRPCQPRAHPITEPLFDGDRSRFVRDVTLPDGTRLKVGQRVRKTWEIQNVGSVTWEGRHLQREGPAKGPGRLKSRDRVRVPYTKPGQTCIISMYLTAPHQPGTCYAEWKMVDDDGNRLLPNQKPVFVSVDVIEE